MKVLVTGGTGFIGRHLIGRLLERGDEIRCLARSEDSELRGGGVEVVRGDITKPSTIRGVAEGSEVIYHLAAVGHVGASTNSAYQNYRRINVTGLGNIVEEIIKSPTMRKLVHFSSTAAMGLIEGRADESTVCRPETPYQRTKYEAEQLLRRKFLSDGLPVVILRPSMVYGPGDNGTDFLSMCRLVKKGRFPVSTSHDGLTPLVYVDDAVQAALLAGDRGEIGETYIITSERSHTIREMVDTISDALGVAKGGIGVPNWTMEVAAVTSELLSRTTGAPPVLTRRRLRSILADRSFDITKAVERLGYAPRVSLRDGVERSIEWYKRNGML